MTFLLPPGTKGLNFNSESAVIPSNFLLKLVARGIPTTETISDFLELSKIWDFPGLAFK